MFYYLPTSSILIFTTLRWNKAAAISGLNNDYKIPFYCCNTHPDIENAHLKSIEHHCPEVHKAEILQL